MRNLGIRKATKNTLGISEDAQSFGRSVMPRVSTTLFNSVSGGRRTSSGSAILSRRAISAWTEKVSLMLDTKPAYVALEMKYPVRKFQRTYAVRDVCVPYGNASRSFLQCPGIGLLGVLSVHPLAKGTRSNLAHRRPARDTMVSNPSGHRQVRQAAWPAQHPYSEKRSQEGFPIACHTVAHRLDEKDIERGAKVTTS